MKVVIDFDNTICDYSGKFERRWFEVFGERVNFDGILTCPEEKVDVFFKDFYEDILPYEGAIDALRALDSKHEVLICTHSESRDVTIQKQKWFTRWLGEKWVSQIVSLEGHTCDKSAIYAQYDVIIEDNPKITGDNVIYYPHPYNKGLKSLIDNFKWSAATLWI